MGGISNILKKIPNAGLETISFRLSEAVNESKDLT